MQQIDTQKPELEKIVKFVASWRNTDKYPCPKCGAILCNPSYTCIPCNIKLQLKVKLKT